jgi:cysteine-rich repeat protein
VIAERHIIQVVGVLGRIRLLLCLLAASGVLTRASAQDLIPASPDFPVTGDITADQSDPVLLTTPSDGFVAVWRSGALGEGLRGRVYDHAVNPVGAEFSFDGLSGPLAAAGRPEAGFIVVGTRYPPDGRGVFGQRYDWAAQAVWAAPIPIADVESAHFPAIAMAADGSFLVAWIGDLASGNASLSSATDVFARAFRHNGAATGPGVRLNETVHDYQGLPSVAVGSDGNYLVTWSAVPEGSENSLLFARIVGPEGQPFGSPLQIETETRLYSWPHVVRVASGFVIAWTGAPERNGVFGRLLTAGGAPIASEFRIDAGAPGYASTGLGGFASLRDGFLALWNVSEWEIRRHTIYAQRFDSAGGRIGVAVRVNSEELGSGANLAAATDSTGGFVAAWQNDRYPLPDPIIARRFVVCGDGVLRGERCDDGNLMDGDGCDSNCTATACGNSVQTLGEDCDDGNLTEGDGCSSECRIQATFTPCAFRSS